MHMFIFPILSLRRLREKGSRSDRRASLISRELSPRETVKLSPKRKLLISCRRGSIWITGGGGPHSDVVLEAGATTAVVAGASVVIEGLRGSCIEIETREE